jgi:hypothetical protein
MLTRPESRVERFAKDSILVDNNYYFAHLTSFNADFNQLFESGAYYRESEGKVYRKDSINKKEALLYDFNLNTNDSIWVEKDGFQNLLICEKTDTIQFLDGSLRRRLKLYCNESNVIHEWIEGFGEAKIYNSIKTGKIFDWCNRESWDSDVTCYFHNDVIAYQDSRFDDCLVSSTVENEIPNAILIPNPAKQSIKLISDIEVREIKIYNASGQIELKTNEAEIDISNLNQGFKIMQIFFKNQRIINKTFIKM